MSAAPDETTESLIDFLEIVERELVRVQHRIIERNAVDAEFITQQLLIHIRARIGMPITGTPRNMRTFDK